MTEQEYLSCMTTKKVKVKPFNESPVEERVKITYYSEKARAQGIKQVLAMLKTI